MNNCFVVYDLISPGQNYEAVRSAIEQLGAYSRIQFSLYYLSTSLSVQQVHDTVRQVMDPNDRLCVILAADAYLSSYSPSFFEALRKQWSA